MADERRWLAVIRLAVNGSADDIDLWLQMQKSRPGARGAEVDEEAELAATLQALGLKEEADGPE